MFIAVFALSDNQCRKHSLSIVTVFHLLPRCPVEGDCSEICRLFCTALFLSVIVILVCFWPFSKRWQSALFHPFFFPKKKKKKKWTRTDGHTRKERLVKNIEPEGKVEHKKNPENLTADELHGLDDLVVFIINHFVLRI